MNGRAPKDFLIGLAVIITAPIWLPALFLWCFYMGVCDIARLRF